MTRISTILAALMLGGATAAWAAGDKAGKAADGSQPATGAAAGSASTSTMGGAAGTSAAMTEDGVRERLQAQGYSAVSGIERKGEKFEAKAEKDGRSVQLEIDPATGAVTETGS